MDRAGRFLNLASLVSVLLAAVAVAMAARRYAVRHRDRIALLKCLGSQQAFILKLNLLQLLMLTLMGAAVGIVLGYISQEANYLHPAPRLCFSALSRRCSSSVALHYPT